MATPQAIELAKQYREVVEMLDEFKDAELVKTKKYKDFIKKLIQLKQQDPLQFQIFDILLTDEYTWDSLVKKSL